MFRLVAQRTAISLTFPPLRFSPLLVPCWPHGNPRYSHSVKDIPEYARQFDPDSRVFSKPKNRNLRKRQNRSARRTAAQEFQMQIKELDKQRIENEEEESEDVAEEVKQRHRSAEINWRVRKALRAEEKMKKLLRDKEKTEKP